MEEKYFSFNRKEDNYKLTLKASKINAISYKDGSGVVEFKNRNGDITLIDVDLTEEKYEEVSEYLTNK